MIVDNDDGDGNGGQRNGRECKYTLSLKMTLNPNRNVINNDI